jgi:hypothetical protein
LLKSLDTSVGYIDTLYNLQLFILELSTSGGKLVVVVVVPILTTEDGHGNPLIGINIY